MTPFSLLLVTLAPLVEAQDQLREGPEEVAKLFEYEAKKVVQGVPRLSKEAVALLEVMQPTL